MDTSLYERIKGKCLIEPIYINTNIHSQSKPDELECILIKKNGKTKYELNVYDCDTYRGVYTGRYCTPEIEQLIQHMLEVFTEETKECTDTIHLYLYYNPEEKTFVHYRFK